MLTDGRFWVGVVAGVALTYAMHAYTARKAAS